MQSKSSVGASAGTAPSVPGKAGDLKARVLSALVLGPLVLGAVWFGGWVFQALIVAAALVAVREWGRMVRPGGGRAEYLCYLSIVAVLIGNAVAGPMPALLVLFALTGVVYLAIGSAGGGDRWVIALGLPYVALGFIALVWLRDDPRGGLALLLYLLLVIWATDIGAYAAGRSIGGPKLAPRISPKKTWAGLIGGMASAAAVGGMAAMAAGAARPLFAAALAGLLAVMGQVGDLFESAFKRRYDVKDSGTLIPGHGGILDRIDGLIAAAPVLALFHALAGDAYAWW
ncbi:MAG TPA: phosphatidate cytidylyltransferase [Azospirillaceae bacterium]|nr:phosphatidate cytidylyltransferase [Azospirillaceae bacterium]